MKIQFSPSSRGKGYKQRQQFNCTAFAELHDQFSGLAQGRGVEHETHGKVRIVKGGLDVRMAEQHGDNAKTTGISRGDVVPQERRSRDCEI